MRFRIGRARRTDPTVLRVGEAPEIADEHPNFINATIVGRGTRRGTWNGMKSLEQADCQDEDHLHDGAGVITFLTELPPDAYLDSETLGRLLGRCKKSIQRATRRGELPPPFKFLGRNVWLVKTILEHMKVRQEAACRKVDRRVRRLDRDLP
jgi:hypothetical protein